MLLRHRARLGRELLLLRWLLHLELTLLLLLRHRTGLRRLLRSWLRRGTRDVVLMLLRLLPELLRCGVLLVRLEHRMLLLLLGGLVGLECRMLLLLLRRLVLRTLHLVAAAPL